jgi:hypothetical protein
MKEHEDLVVESMMPMGAAWQLTGELRTETNIEFDFVSNSERDSSAENAIGNDIAAKPNAPGAQV